MEEDLLVYERKYGILSETCYESYMQGDEPPDNIWILDWNDWAGAYQIWLRRRQQYQEVIRSMKQQIPLVQVIEKVVRREPLSVAA